LQVKGAAASVRDGARATLDVRASTTRGAAADAEWPRQTRVPGRIPRSLHPPQQDLLIMKSIHGNSSRACFAKSCGPIHPA